MNASTPTPRRLLWSSARLFLLLLFSLLAGRAPAALSISEFLSTNDGWLPDEDLESPGWIELFNSGPGAVNLNGWHLTDDAGNLAKWTFPATNLSSGSCLVVFASGKARAIAGRPLHTNFQLDGNGGYLALVQPDGVTIAHVYHDYPPQRFNVSYGINGASALRYFSPPTPGATNAPGYLGLVADVQFSVPRGFYDSPIAVSLSTTNVGATVYWTTNGSIPAPANGTLYTGPIAISKNTFLRAAGSLSNYVSSIPITHTYLFLNQVIHQPNSNGLPGYPIIWQASYPADYEMDPNVINSANYGPTLSNDLRSIPTLSIVSTHSNFWDQANGIYVNSTSTGSNWERAASVELFDGDNTSEFQINCGVMVHGNSTRDNVRLAKHSFALGFKSDYGPSKLHYDWFPGSPVNKFDKIVLRACSTDSWATRSVEPRYRPSDSIYLRDIWMREAMTDLGWLSSRNSEVHLYINGLYWGLYNPCERLDAAFYNMHLGGYEKDWDVMAGDETYDVAEVRDGTKADWNSMMALVNAGVTNEAAYQAVAQLVDVDNLIDYMLLHILAEAEDWPMHNWYAGHRHANSTNGLPATKWIFQAWDQEVVMDPTVSRDRVNVTDADTPAHIYSQLRAWPEFRRQFGDRVQKHLFNGGKLTVSNNIARFQSLATRINRAVVAESARWGDAREFTIGVNPGTGNTFTRDEWWVPELQLLYTNYLVNINNLTLSRLRSNSLYPTLGAPQFSQFGGAISNGFALVLTHTNAVGAILYTLDGLDPRVYGTGAAAPSAQTYSAPIILNATTAVRARVLNSGQWSALVETVYYPPQDLSKLALTELMYHPPDLGSTNSDEFEFLELKNCGTNTLDLSGLTFTSGITFTFTNGTLLAPGQFFVLARNAAAFAAKYPGVPLRGIYTGKLDNGGEKVALSTALGTPVFSVTYSDRYPWPVTPDIANFSLVPVNPGASQAPDKGSAWRASTNPGGSPNADDPAPVAPGILINEILTHTDPPQKDAVELLNPTATSANIGGWYLSDDADTAKKFRIPDNTIIPAGGRVVFAEDDFNSTPGVGTSFAFSSSGDDVLLFAATNNQLTGYSDSVSFGAMFNGVSFGRCVNSAGEAFFPLQTAVTLGAVNAGPRLGPVVINEINYHPDVNGDEFVELLNWSSNAVPLFDAAHPTNAWRIGGIAYTLPTNQTLGAYSTLLVVATNPAAFRAKYSVPAGLLIIGPYSGQLQDGGENVELQAPDNPNADGSVPYVVVDAVKYDNKSPWPPAANGSGMSLQRIFPSNFGNEPLNWAAATPTPGGLSASGDADGDGLTDAWEVANGTQLFVSDANDDPDHDGFSNLQEYLAGTRPHDPTSLLKLQPIIANVGGITMQFLAASNHSYTVLYKLSLPDATWLKLSDVSPSPSDRILNITNSTGTTMGFYHLVTPAQP
jgi:hypothetical protein